MGTFNQSVQVIRKYALIIIVLATGGLLALPPLPEALAFPFNPLPDQPGFEGGKVLSGTAPNNSSPVLADLNNDGREEIVVGGADGRVYAVASNGALLWQFDVGQAISAAAPRPGGGLVEATPAAADLDGDGWYEVVVTIAPPSDALAGHNGGTVVLSHNGVLKPGWPQVTLDNTHDGYAEGIFSSPALGDLDGDGDLEIVAGSWDMRVYAWHHDGRLVDGWPRFVAETVHSSPAMADLDNDGHLEVIIGVPSHTYPPMGLLDGGYLHVFRADGAEMAGFPKYIDQAMDSSPAIGDINGDGSLDIIVGTGTYYSGKGYAVYAWDRYGNPLPGWPVTTGGYVLSSPSLGDIDGDGVLEVLVGCNDGKLYALNGNGTSVPGWPVAVQDNFGTVGPFHWSSAVLANFDSDGSPEVFINRGCDVAVLDGNGTHLTHVGASPDGKPTIWMGNSWCPYTTPAVGDIDDDGKLEIVRSGGNDLYNRGNLLLSVWESDRTPPGVVWAMFRGDSAHHAVLRPTATTNAQIVHHDLPDIMLPGMVYDAHITVGNTGTITWTKTNADCLAALPQDPLAVYSRACLGPGETIAPGHQKTFTVRLQAPTAQGYYVTTWRMVHQDATFFGQAVSRRIKVGSEPSVYVMYKNDTGIYAGGLASSISPPPGFTNWWAVQGLGLAPQNSGYYFILDKYGAIWCGGRGDCFGSWAPWGTATQEILMLDHGKAFYVLDKNGVVYEGSGAYAISPPPPTLAGSLACSAALTPDEHGIYVLDGYGNVYVGGNAPVLTPATPHFSGNVAKRFKLTADGNGYYVLDAYGQVWNGGTAPPLAPNYAYHIGEDWARDLELTGAGQGYYLLDKYGNICTGGNAQPVTINVPPIGSSDQAVDLVVVDSRVMKEPYLMPSATTVSMIMVYGGALPSRRIVLSNVGGGSELTWEGTPSPSVSWLAVSPISGTTPTTVTLSVTKPLTIGTYSTTLTLDAADSSGNPANAMDVQVVFYVWKEVYQAHLPLVFKHW